MKHRKDSLVTLNTSRSGRASFARPCSVGSVGWSRSGDDPGSITVLLYDESGRERGDRPTARLEMPVPAAAAIAVEMLRRVATERLRPEWNNCPDYQDRIDAWVRENIAALLKEQR